MRPVAVALLLTASTSFAGGRGSRESIHTALSWLYPGAHAYRFAIDPRPDEDAPPLAEVVVFRATRPVPHWHYVTYGLSELDGKRSTDPRLSGFGVEYTLRLVDDSPAPPEWPINLLRFLAAQTWATRAPYDPTHSARLPGPMLESVSSGVEGFAGFEDVDLKPLDTPSGRVTFVNIIPLMKGEYALIGSWNALKVAEEIRATQGDLLWRHGRTSLLSGPRAAEIKKRAERDGSSQEVVFTDFTCEPKQLVLDFAGAESLGQFLRYRLPYGREGRLLSGDRTLQINAAAWAYKPGTKFSSLSVPRTEAKKLADEISKVKVKTVITRPGGVSLAIDPTH